MQNLQYGIHKCRICNMEFTDPERTKIHMIKAHSKPKREK